MIALRLDPAMMPRISPTFAAGCDEWIGPVIVPPDQWKPPAGASGDNAGPS